MTQAAVPPVHAIAPRLDIARAHARWKAAVAAQDLEAAAGIAASVLDLQAPAHASSAQKAMRLWYVEALTRAGKADEAAVWLDRIEREHQPSHTTRFLAARMRYFRGDFDGAAAAAAEALILLPLAKKPTAQYYAILRFRADALALAGRQADARRMLLTVLAHKDPWASDDIKALRQTVVTEADLDHFHAFLTPYFSFPGVRARAALYHYSMACRDLGLYDRAELAIRRRFVTGAKLVEFGHHPPSQTGKKAWVNDARVTLKDLKAVMDAVGVEFFLISGTLLGAVRENDILGHDKDIDVGVMDTPGLDKTALETALRGSGKFSVKPYQVPTLLRVQHASGVMIDVFWHRLEDGLIVHEGMKSKWWNAPFDLVDLPFLGDTYRGPDNYSRYLGENYGNWEKPDAEFETFVDTPNMVVTSEGEIVWYYYCKLFDYYNQGRAPQFRKVAAALKALRPHDREVHEIVNRVLSAHDAFRPIRNMEIEEPLDDIVFDPLDDDRLTVTVAEDGHADATDAEAEEAEAEAEEEAVEADDRDHED